MLPLIYSPKLCRPYSYAKFFLLISIALGTIGLLGQASPVSAAAVEEYPVISAPRPIEQGSNCGVSSYRVRPGDTISAIARRAGTSSRAIRQCNGLSSNVIYAGQVLSIPGVVGNAVSTPQARVSRSYTPSSPAYTPPSQAPRPSDNPYYTPRRPAPGGN